MDITIAVCDDEDIEREYLRQMINAWAKSGDVSIKLLLYPSAEAFLFAHEEISVDIALLDVRMGAMDGISLAKSLRREDDRMEIVFITGLPEFIADGYEVAALHYLIKPVSEAKLFDVLDRAVKRLGTKGATVLLPLKDGKQRLPAAEIYYVEAFSHDLHIHTAQETFIIKMTMNEMERLLGQEFFRCHRSFLANIRLVRKITKDALEMEDGRVLPLSRRHAVKAMEAFIESH